MVVRKFKISRRIKVEVRAVVPAYNSAIKLLVTIK